MFIYSHSTQFSRVFCCRPEPLWLPPAVSLQISSPTGNFPESCSRPLSPRLPEGPWPTSGSRPAAFAPPSAPPAQLAGLVWHKPRLRRLWWGHLWMTRASALSGMGPKDRSFLTVVLISDPRGLPSRFGTPDSNHLMTRSECQQVWRLSITHSFQSGVLKQGNI